MTTAPVDVSVLKALVGDDPAMISELLQDFRLSATKIAAELRSACAAGQASASSAAAHKLKSSSRAVGALALGDLCDEIEQAGKLGQVEALAALLEPGQLGALVERIFDEQLGAPARPFDAEREIGGGVGGQAAGRDRRVDRVAGPRLEDQPPQIGRGRAKP